TPSKPAAFRGGELQGTITVTITAQASWKDDGDEQPSSQSINRTAIHLVKFSTVEAFPDNPQGVATFRGQEVSFSASVRDKTNGEAAEGGVSGRCPGGRDVSLGEVICADGAVSLMVIHGQHVYGFRFNTLVVPTGGGEIQVPGFRVGPAPLPPDSEARLTGSQAIVLKQSQKVGIYQQLGDVKAVVSWNFEPPNLAEVLLESEDYKQWIPEGNYKDLLGTGNSIRFKATVRKRGDPDGKDQKARITFHLDGVSMENGVCLNFPLEPGKPDYDLKILKEHNTGLEVTGSDEAKTRGEVHETTLTISSFDYGAWGNLKVTAEASGGPIPVTFQGKKEPTITLPQNDTGQHIASAWLRQAGMEGSPDTTDQAQAAGQQAKGDGLSLYEKYRGMVVAEGGSHVFKRLEPKRKVHFIIDDKGLINPSRWESATDTVIYKLDNELVNRRRVNFNGGYAGSGAKFAVRLAVVTGLKDPDRGIFPPQQLGYTEGASPGKATPCRVFPDRIRAKIGRIATAIQEGVNDPNSEEGQFLRQLTIPPDEARRLLATLPQRQEQLATRLLSLVALHESIHACGVPGHGPLAVFPNQWEERDADTDVSCPMQTMGRAAWRFFVLHGILGGSGKLCPLCASQFSVTN
ncbi:MAG: hypothetical protein NTY38_29965, partial [Acidobacteria bacterium]|nr:hypothetical protein [Acidobacteriota bacterium]